MSSEDRSIDLIHADSLKNDYSVWILANVIERLSTALDACFCLDKLHLFINMGVFALL